MAERIIHFPVPNEIQQTIAKPTIVCTDDFLICNFIDRNLNKLYAYSFSKYEWQVWQIDLPPTFIHLNMVIVDQKNLIIHGKMEDDIPNTIFRTYMGDITERPIRFQIIGTIETPAIYCDFTTNGSDNLCAVIMVHNEHDNDSIEFFMHRLNTVNLWTPIPCDLQQYNIRRIRDSVVCFNFAYGCKLYTFATKEDEFKVDFSKMIAVDLRTGHTSTVDLRPADGPQPGFPRMFSYFFNRSLARCPVEPGHAYLVFGNEQGAWEVWRVDVDAARWHRLPPVVGGPEATTSSTISAAIAPSGRMYVLHQDYSLHSDDDARDDSGADAEEPPPHARRLPYDLFCSSVRVIALEDLCLDAAMALLRAVDPSWPRARTVRNVAQWMMKRRAAAAAAGGA